jgi:hypothetical protein
MSDGWNPIPDKDWSPSPEPESGDDFVDLAEFPDENEFLIVRGLLESAGIECLAPDYPRHKLERYLLQVRKHDIETARALMEPPTDSDAEWVDFAEFDSEQEFIVVRGLLESAGIECFTPKQVWSRGTSFPLILQLHPQDVEKAQALIESSPEAVPEASDGRGE